VNFYECDRDLVDAVFRTFGAGKQEVNFWECENAMKGVKEIPLEGGKGANEVLARARRTAGEVSKKLEVGESKDIFASRDGRRVTTRVEFIDFGVTDAQVTADEMWLLASVLDWGRKGEVTEADFKMLLKGTYDPIELLELSKPSIYSLADIALPLRTRLSRKELVAIKVSVNEEI
jgi:hypothetical protein